MAGFYEGTDLADKTFVGFRFNPDTGHLDIEVITPDDGDAVVLPQEGVIDKYDYVQWVWTRDTLSFQWGNKGHLQVKML